MSYRISQGGFIARNLYRAGYRRYRGGWRRSRSSRYGTAWGGARYGRSTGYRRRLPMSAIPRALVPETKYYTNNTDWDGISIANSSNPHYLDLGQAFTNGTADGERVGNKVFLKYIHLRFHVYANPDSKAASYMPTIRVACVNDKLSYYANTGGFGSAADYLQQIFEMEGVGSDQDMVAFPRSSNLSRFRVLKDNVMNLTFSSNTPGDANPMGGVPFAKRDWFIPVNRVVTFADAGQHAPVGDNFLFFAFSNVASGEPTLYGMYRLAYTDV